MRARLVSLAVLAAATLPGAARGQDLNVITSVALKDEGSTIVLTVKGSKPPNFTTFSMADPPRFVIDLSESRFEGVPEDIVVQDGIVNVVKDLSYGSAATSIARIMIAFQVDVEPPDVQTSGTNLLVRVAKPGAPAVAAAKPAAPAPQAAPAAEPASAAAPAATSAGGGGGGAAAVGATAAAAAASGDKDQQAKQQAEAQARADEQRKAEEAAAAAAAAKAEEDRKAREAADAQAKAKAAADEQARLEKEAVEREQAEAKARDEAEARKAAEKQGGAKVAVAAPAAAPAAREEPPPPPPAPAEPVAPAPAPAPAPTPAPTARLEAGAPSAQLREVGFRQMPGASRVYVRTSVTPRFTVQDVGQNTIRVELENTRVSRKNDTRFLDTSFFSSAVAMVTPSRRGSTYVVEIKLREKVPYQQKIEGDMLALDFERPARAQPAPAAGSAAGEAAGADAAPAPGPRDDTGPAAAPAEPARPAEGEPPPTLK